jgi:hypothetical protein
MTSSHDPHAIIDGWINPNFGSLQGRDRDVTYLFPGLRERLERGTTLDQLIEEMDAAGVTKGVLCSGYAGEGDLPWVRAAIEKYPERFVGSHVVDPRTGMAAVRLVEQLVRQDGFRLIRILGLQTQIYYNDAMCYPVYAKCVELDVPVGLNVGFPGPLVPSKYQDPLPIDDVCSFFPDLTVVLQHGGEPWVDLCVKLMLKWPRVFYMSSAIAPRHIPPAILQYANTRGRDRVLFGSDYPLLTHERCAGEIAALPFKDAERRREFSAANAERLFFAPPT